MEQTTQGQAELPGNVQHQQTFPQGQGQMGQQQFPPQYNNQRPQGAQPPKQGQVQQPTQYTLYVGDLQKNVTEEQLYQEFSQYGQINIKIVKDHNTSQSRGYAFVNFQDASSANNAFNALNYKPINGKNIRIMQNQKDAAIRNSTNGNIFIKNLDKTVTSRMLFDQFSQFGEITSCKVSTDDTGESKGFGFVHFHNEEDAQKAITNCNHIEFAGKVIYVGPFIKNQFRQSQSDTFNNLYVKNLPDDTTEEELKNLFGNYGQILSLLIRKDKQLRTFAFVCFEQFEDAKRAKEELDQQDFKGQTLYVAKFENKSERVRKLTKDYQERKRKWAEVTKGCNLYVKNLDEKVTDVDLRQLFQQFGEISSCKVMTEKQYIANVGVVGEAEKSKGFGFVCFKRQEDAEKAKNQINNITLNEKHLYVNFAEPKEQRLPRIQQRIQKYGYSDKFNTQNCIYCQQQMMMMQYQQMFRMYQNYSQPQMPYGYRNPYQMYNYGQMRRPMMQNRMDPSMYQQNINRNTLGQRAIHQQSRGQGQYRRQQNYNRNFDQQQQQQQQEQQILNPNELTGKSQQEQQQLIGEKLYQMIFESQPKMAGKITGMLLEMEIDVLLMLLRNRTALKEKIQEAVEVLEKYEKDQAQ